MLALAIVSEFCVHLSFYEIEFHLCYSDGETFISADDLRINLWNLEISNQSFNIVDVKPQNMEDLTGMSKLALQKNEKRLMSGLCSCLFQFCSNNLEVWC